MALILGDKDNKRALYEALTRYNYFPNQRISIGELPPSIDSRQFTPEVAEALVAVVDKRKMGYDLVTYSSTRYNNVPRVLGLIHPKPYSALVKCIHENWDELSYVTRNDNSIIKPQFYYAEKRLVIMNYEDPINKISRSHQKAFGKRFIVNTDIANCFNSIYCHAIPWALVTTNEAKKQRSQALWFNHLDRCQQRTKRGETQGIPIGPATSSIVAELILGRVDDQLRASGYDFYRYVDDYTCYCKTDDDAHQFLRDLGRFLSIYKLTLNLKKTTIKSLPCSTEDEWVLKLRGSLPGSLADRPDSKLELSVPEALTFLNRAIELNKVTPDGSVLKYAVSVMFSRLDEDMIFNIIDPVLNLSWHYPVLLPLLDSIFKKNQFDINHYLENFTEIIRENSKCGRSDGMAWPLHTLLTRGAVVDEITADMVISSRDCIAITLLLEMNVYNEKVINFTKSIESSDDDYEKDSYWLLLYQLYSKGLIDDPYGDDVFAVLKKYDVNFVPGDSKTDAEKECDRIKEQLISDAARAAFSEVPPINNLF